MAVKGTLDRGYFTAEDGTRYRVKFAWLVPQRYPQDVTATIVEVENPRKALRTEPETVMMAVDVGLHERSEISLAVMEGKTYRNHRRFYGPPDVPCPEGHFVVVAYRHEYNQPHPAEYVSKPVVINGPLPLPEHWFPS
jgi:hypothetical protein